jgi:hypothetical protein
VIIQTSEMLDNLVAAAVPGIDPKGKMRLGFHGQVRLDSSWPIDIYTPCCCVCVPAQTATSNLVYPAQRRNRHPGTAGFTRSNWTASDNTRPSCYLAQANVADFSKQVELALFFDAKLDVAT